MTAAIRLLQREEGERESLFFVDLMYGRFVFQVHTTVFLVVVVVVIVVVVVVLQSTWLIPSLCEHFLTIPPTQHNCENIGGQVLR